MTVPTTTGFAATAMDAGGYSFVSNTDAWIACGGATVVAVVPSARAAAAAMPALNGHAYLPAGTTVSLTFGGGITHFSMIAVASAGEVQITGPWGHATNHA
jgi:nicotinamidase-related amidase